MPLVVICPWLARRLRVPGWGIPFESVLRTTRQNQLPADSKVPNNSQPPKPAVEIAEHHHGSHWDNRYSQGNGDRPQAKPACLAA